MGTAGGRSLPRGAARPDKTRDSHTSSGARRSWTCLPRPAGGFPADFLVDGKPAQAQELRTDPDSEQHSPRLTIGTLKMYVIRREARFALRIKDSESPTLTGFHGLRWYDPNAKYRVTAKWLPYNPAKTVTLATLIGTTYNQ